MSGIQIPQPYNYNPLNNYGAASGPGQTTGTPDPVVGGGVTNNTPKLVGTPESGTPKSDLYTMPSGRSFSENFIQDVKNILDNVFGKDTAATEKQKIVDLIKELWAKPLEVGDKLAALIVETAGNKSRQQLQDAVSESDLAAAQLMQQAATMREAATMMIIGAAVQLGMTVASSVISIAGATTKIGQLNDAPTGAGEMKAINLAQAAGDRTQAIAQLVGAIGTFVNQVMQAQVKNIEADGAQWAAEAQRTNARHDISQKLADDLQKLADQIAQLLAEIQQTTVAMMQTMTRV
ncbi:hypothetical protein [Methyloraptor flagellatus]|jgi:hypothetical protein|uniref:Uncharacterized protein n=1 Tax=Methyloraptor flagellatus TaxID=3162530 RepID=A0AAU7X504_9HYPH